MSGLDDFDESSRAATGGSVGGGTSVGGGGAGGTGGNGGDPNTGGGVAALRDEGLIARYFLDEGSDGEVPSTVLDAGPDSLDLQVNPANNMVYRDGPAGRGIEWTTEQSSGAAWRAGVCDVLNQNTDATIEAVVAATGGNLTSRVFQVGSGGTTGRFSLSITQNPPGYQLRLNDSLDWGVWAWPVAQRHVVHVRVDLDRPDAMERTALFVDGMRQPRTGGNPMAGATVQIDPNTQFTLGNRADEMRSPDGRIYYLAIYRVAFDDVRIAQHAARLQNSDDMP